MEKSIAVFAIINLSIIGLSHLFQHDGWREFFSVLHDKGRIGAFANGFLALFMGSMVVSFHNVWTGVPVILTLMGWAWLAKAASIFLFPDWNVRSMQSARNASPLKLRIAGLGLLSIALTLGMCLAFEQY